MPLRKETREIQNQLGRYCQTGQLKTAPVKARQDRLPHYRRLVFNVILDSLSSAYPLCRKLVGDAVFEELVDEFFQKNACQEPQVFRMTGEFYTYFENLPKHPVKNQFPFLTDLLRFEWTEMDMYMMEDVKIDKQEIANSGNWLQDSLALNPESRLLQFDFPVFKKKPNELKAEDKALYYCFAFREPTTGKIFFLDVSPVVAIILTEIAERRNLETIFLALEENGLSLHSDIQEKIINFLKSEKQNGLILGFYTQ